MAGAPVTDARKTRAAVRFVKALRISSCRSGAAIAVACAHTDRAEVDEPHFLRLDNSIICEAYKSFYRPRWVESGLRTHRGVITHSMFRASKRSGG